MTQITEQQKDSLKKCIFDMLISDPEKGLGDISDCYEAAEYCIQEWMELNNITLLENELP